MENLVPPSHFDPDSLSGSPQMLHNPHESPKSTLSHLHPSSKPILKTPQDFAIPMNQNVQPRSSRFAEKEVPRLQPLLQAHHHHSILQDSGYDWEQSKHDFIPGRQPPDDGIKMLLRELKDENQHLKGLLQSSQPEKNSKCSVDVITHQVQYIERLQRDIADVNRKLSDRENELSNREVCLHEKDCRIQQLNLDFNQLRDRLKEEKQQSSKMADAIGNMRASLMSSEEEKERLRMEHQSTLVVFEQKHENEMRSIGENARKIREEMEKHFENQRSSWEQESAHHLREWEAKWQQLSNQHEAEVDEKAQETERERKTLCEQNKLLQNKLDDSCSKELKLKAELLSLNQELQKSKISIEDLQRELEGLHSSVQDEKEKNVKLRAYVSQVQVDEHAREQWKTERVKMDNAFQALHEEKEELLKTLEMLNVRFQSVSKILEMQEEAITAHTSAIADVERQNKAAVVISQWRAKVFELMVQCKSREICLKEEEARHKIAVKTLEQQLQDQTRECGMLSNRVKDVEAQLQHKEHLYKTMEVKKEKLSDEVEGWKTKVNNQNSSIAKLRSTAESLAGNCMQVYEKSLCVCMEKFLRMEQRLSFANNRIRSIQDLLKRRDTMWRVRLQQVNQGKANAPPEENLPNPDLEVEILHLTEERDALTQQLAHDAANFEKSISNMKKKEENFLQVNRDLEKQIISLEEKIQELGEENEKLRSVIEDEKHEKDDLEAELSEIKTSVKRDINLAVEESKSAHSEELNEKEKALNQVKRELTKTVVALRQAERSAAREKNRLIEELETHKQMRFSDEEKLREDIKKLQKDNNLLMCTLRQEGLLSTFKAAREPPITVREDNDIARKRVHFESPPAGSREASKTDNASVEVDKMLQDLTNLSEKVLADRDSDSNT